MQKDKDMGFPNPGYQLPHPCPQGSAGIKKSNNLVGPQTDVLGKEGICHLENDLYLVWPYNLLSKLA